MDNMAWHYVRINKVLPCLLCTITYRRKDEEHPLPGYGANKRKSRPSAGPGQAEKQAKCQRGEQPKARRASSPGPCACQMGMPEQQGQLSTTKPRAPHA